MGTQNSKSCIFCEILEGKREGNIIYQDDKIFAFHDLRKYGAQEHILICPKEHIKDVNSLNKSHIDLLNHMHNKGIQLLNEINPNAEKRFGFHLKLKMIDHLHLHAAIGPFGFFGDKIFYGMGLRTIEEQIELLKKI